MRRSDLVLPSRAKASKNLHFLRVVASRLAKGSGDGVRNGLLRVGGAIVVVRMVCLHFSIFNFGVYARARRIMTPTVTISFVHQSTQRTTLLEHASAEMIKELVDLDFTETA